MIKILVPIDFSETSRKALEYAIHLSKNASVNIKMLYVASPPTKSGTKLLQKMQEMTKDEDRQMVSSKTTDFVKDIQGSDQVDHNTIIRYGDVSKQIINVSLQEDFDLVVMGTKGSGWLRENFIGSNTFSSLKMAVVPTIVVPKVYDANTASDNACIALRFDKLYGNSCSKLLSRTKALGYNPDLISVVEGKSDDLSLAITFDERSYDVTLYENPRPRKAIAEHLSKHNIGLLALHFNSYSFFKELTYKSVSTEFTFRSNIPILFMR